MRLTANSALKTAEEGRKLTRFNKQWSIGDKATVFYPVYKDPTTGKVELLVGAIHGNTCDFQELGLKTSFIPANCDIVDGIPVNPSIAVRFSRVAAAFINGEKQARITKIASKNYPSEEQRKKAIEEVEKEYDTKNNMQAKRPVIGFLKYLISTECLYIPMNNDNPNTDSMKVVTQEPSSTKIATLTTIANDAKYQPDFDEEGIGYLEVQYSFISANNTKGEAARVSPVGVTKEYSLQTRFPDLWPSIVNELKRISLDAEDIAKRNYNYNKIPEDKIIEALRLYCVKHNEDLVTADVDNLQIVRRNAEVLKMLNYCSDNEEFDREFGFADNPTTETPATTGTTEPTYSGSPSLEQILNGDDLLADPVEV